MYGTRVVLNCYQTVKNEKQNKVFLVIYDVRLNSILVTSLTVTFHFYLDITSGITPTFLHKISLGVAVFAQ